MAYFANGSEGGVFDEQCSECKYGDDYCPIFYVQVEYNYEACNNKIARAILENLVKDDGTCEMFRHFKEDFKRDK